MSSASEMQPDTAYQTTSIPAAINVLDVIRGVGRRKLLVLGTTLFAFAAALGVVSMLKPLYTSEAQVLIQNLETPFDRVQPAEGQRPDAIDDRVVASQISVIRSEDLGRRVVAALGLENRAEFNALLGPPSRLADLKVRLGFGADPALKTPERRALDRYVDRLNVYQLPQSNVIAIEFTSTDAETAASIANTLADTFVLWTRESQSRPTERARSWLFEQIESLRLKLAASEEAAERFRAEAGLIKGQTSTLGEQEISELNTQITLARTSRLEARARADAARQMLESGGSLDSAADVLNSAAVQRLKEQRTEAMRRMSELSAVYLANHPRMVAVENELANIDRQIRAEALKIVASLEEQAKLSESRERSLIASLEGLKGQEGAANLNDVKLKALERDAAADRALLEAMLGRYAEASARQDLASQPGQAVVIQSASVAPVPSFPKTGPMVALITVAGLGLGLGLAFLIELMAAAAGAVPQATGQGDWRREPPLAPPRVDIPPEAPSAVAASTVAAIAASMARAESAASPPPAPAPRLAEEEAEAPPPDKPLAVWPRMLPQRGRGAAIDGDAAAAAARVMADWLDDVRGDGAVRRVGFVTLGGGPADLPAAALAVARHAAHAGARVALVDLARSGTALVELSGIDDGPGLSDLVTGQAHFTKIISRDRHSSVHLLRYGHDQSADGESAVRERIGSVLQALGQTYDLVLVSLGEAAQDSPLYLHKCEAAILLASQPRVPEAAAAVRTLLDCGLAAARHVLIGQPAMRIPPLQASRAAAL